MSNNDNPRCGFGEDHLASSVMIRRPIVRAAGCTYTYSRMRSRWERENDERERARSIANETSVSGRPSCCWPPLQRAVCESSWCFPVPSCDKSRLPPTGQLPRPLRCGRTWLLWESSVESSVQRVMAVRTSHQHGSHKRNPLSSTSRRARAGTNYGAASGDSVKATTECSAYYDESHWQERVVYRFL